MPLPSPIKNAKNQTQNCHGVDRPKSAPDLHTRPMNDLLLSEGATNKAKEADHFAFLISDVVIPDGTPRLDVVASLADAGIQWWRNGKKNEYVTTSLFEGPFPITSPETFLSELSGELTARQRTVRRAKSRGACSSHRHSAGTIVQLRF